MGGSSIDFRHLCQLVGHSKDCGGGGPWQWKLQVSAVVLRVSRAFCCPSPIGEAMLKGPSQHTGVPNQGTA